MGWADDGLSLIAFQRSEKQSSHPLRVAHFFERPRTSPIAATVQRNPRCGRHPASKSKAAGPPHFSVSKSTLGATFAFEAASK